MPFLDALNPKSWLDCLRRNRDPILDDDSPAEVDGWIRIYDATTLLARPDIAQYVSAIERDIPIRTEHTCRLRTMMLHHVASMCQLLPASEYYHHSEPGGLLAHHLHCMYLAGTAQYQIHQLVDPHGQSVLTGDDAVYWTNFCFQVRALTHDLGKILTMIEITLRIELKNGEIEYEAYDPMCGGFLEFDLETVAYRHYARGARSVRYNYTFSKANGIHDHEKYWEAAIHNLSSRFFGPAVPGKFVSLHLTDTDDFVRFLKPKLQEIDHRSVELYQQSRRSRADRSTAIATILLSAIASHPRLDSCKLLVGDDGAPRLFIPYPFIQALVNELPESYENSILPRHPEQFIFSLKAAGYADTCLEMPTNRSFVHQFEGLSGVFLHPSLTDHVLGFRLRGSFVSGSSYAVSDLSNPLPPSIDTSEGMISSADRHATDSSSVEDSHPRSLGSSPDPGTVSDTEVSPLLLDPHEATRKALLDLVPETSLSSEDPPLDRLLSVDEPMSSSVALAASEAAAPSATSIPSTSKTTSTLSVVTDFLLESRLNFVDNPKFAVIESGRLILNGVYLAHVFSELQSRGILHRNQVRNFRRRFAAGHPGCWSLFGTDLVCTPEFTSLLLSGPDSSPAVVITPGCPTDSEPDPAIFDVLINIETEDRSEDQVHVFPCRDSRADTLGVHTASALPSFAPGASPQEILTGTLANALSLRRSGQRDAIEYDGRLVRIAFSALDAYTGDRQLRGKVLESLRRLGVYSSHLKATAVLITDTHPEVQACLADLQPKR